MWEVKERSSELQVWNRSELVAYASLSSVLEEDDAAYATMKLVSTFPESISLLRILPFIFTLPFRPEKWAFLDPLEPVMRRATPRRRHGARGRSAPVAAPWTLVPPLPDEQWGGLYSPLKAAGGPLFCVYMGDKEATLRAAWMAALPCAYQAFRRLHPAFKKGAYLTGKELAFATLSTVQHFPTEYDYDNHMKLVRAIQAIDAKQDLTVL